jgi:putative transposase
VRYQFINEASLPLVYNAVAESFFASLKKERIYSSNYKTRKEAKNDIIDYIEMFYNSFRRHSHLENQSPRKFIEICNNKKRIA